MRLQQLTNPESGSLSVVQALEDFKLHQRTSRNSPRTLEYYDFCLSRFRDWLSGQGIFRVEEVDSNMLRRFTLELEQRMKPSSVHAIMRGVRALFKFLEREELIASNPMQKVRMPKQDRTILPAFTPDEVKALEKATDGKEPVHIRNRALVFLLLDSGLRLAECASLRVGDIDPQTGVLKVMGKGRKERVTKLGAVALKTFTRYARLRGGDMGEPLWLGRRGPMTAAGIAETLEKLGKSAGVHSHPHKFRRTCALYMLRSGADVFSVQYLLGHADLAVLRRYLAQTDADVTKAHERHSPVDGLKGVAR